MEDYLEVLGGIEDFNKEPFNIDLPFVLYGQASSKISGCSNVTSPGTFCQFLVKPTSSKLDSGEAYCVIDRNMEIK